MECGGYNILLYYNLVRKTDVEFKFDKSVPKGEYGEVSCGEETEPCSYFYTVSVSEACGGGLSGGSVFLIMLI